MSDHRTLFQRIFYRVIQYSARIAATIYLRFHSVNLHHIPREGSALLCCNHQSNLDPALIGLACPRMMNYMAGKWLFNSRFFGWLISMLDAIPLDRDGIGITGIKECLKRLKRGEIVLMFPEGTRTFDGELAEFKPGFLALARRAKAPLVPMALDGAFSAWPRGQKLPMPSPVVLSAGEPIYFEEYEFMNDDDLIQLLRERIAECLKRSRKIVERM